MAQRRKVLECESYLLARAKKCSTQAITKQPVPEKEGALSCDKIEIEDFISTGQFGVNTPGRFPTGFGIEYYTDRFHGGTIYNDAASGLIWVENQVSLCAYKAVMGTSCLNSGCGIRL